MTWDAYNRRKAALREIFTIVDSRRDLTPTELLDRVDPQREAFEDEAWMLMEIQCAWFQRLSGALDRVASEFETTPEEVAITAWVETAHDMPGPRSLLDANIDEPILAKGLSRERAMMSAFAGARGQGERIIEVARSRAIYPIVANELPETNDETRPPSLVARLRSVLAA